MNIGQNFSPTQNDPQQQPQAGSPIQSVIQVLKLRFPHVFGAMAPAAPGLLAGNSMMPPSGASPLPLPGGMAPGTMPSASPLPMPQIMQPSGPQALQGGGTVQSPVLHYQPNPSLPGGTAGPNPPGIFPPQNGGRRPPLPNPLHSRIPQA